MLGWDRVGRQRKSTAFDASASVVVESGFNRASLEGIATLKNLPRSRPRLLATSVVALLVVVGGVVLVRGLVPLDGLTRRLETRFGRTPYAAVAEYRGVFPGRAGRSLGPATIVADSRGEGFQQLFWNVHHGVGMMDHDGHGMRNLDQFNLPPSFSRTEPFAALMAPYDIDRDGRSEVVAVAPRHDLQEWRLWVIDVDGQVVKGEAALPVGPDARRPDGVWDGAYYPVASFEMPGLPHPAVLLVCIVLHDVDGRGVLAVDPVAGDVLWRFDMACAPSPWQTQIVDLDGDGISEIVLAGASPHNLKGELINHASDDSTRVFVLENRGELRWQRALGGANDVANISVIALDAVGTPGIVTTAADPHGRGGRLSVWSANGDLLFDDAERSRRPYYVAAIPPDGDEPWVVAVLNNDYWLETYCWVGHELEPVAGRRVAGWSRIADVVPAVTGPSSRQLLVAEPDRVCVLDARLRLLATMPTEVDQLKAKPIVWQARPDLRYLILPGASAFAYTFEPQPLVPGWVLATAAGAVLAVVVAVYRRLDTRRRAARRSGIETDPALVRMMRREMLGLLEKGGHEKIGVLKSLRRLIWHLEADAVSTLPGDEAGGGQGATRAASPLGQRASAALVTFRHEALPLLREVLSLAHRTQVAPHVAATVAEILDEAESLLADDSLARRHLDDLLTAAKRLDREAEAALQRLRRTVEETFRSSLSQAVIRVLDAQAEALREAGVLVEIAGGESQDGAPWVHVDPADLEFIVDNLIGNAIRAMAEAPRRVLQIAWKVERGLVECLVTDSGCGIAPDDWERIFEPGASDRQGGGLGLARSRRELSIYGGTLKVAASQPGRGTTFSLRLPVAREAAVGSSSGEATPWASLERGNLT